MEFPNIKNIANTDIKLAVQNNPWQGDLDQLKQSALKIPTGDNTEFLSAFEKECELFLTKIISSKSLEGLNGYKTTISEVKQLNEPAAQAMWRALESLVAKAQSTIIRKG